MYACTCVPVSIPQQGPPTVTDGPLAKGQRGSAAVEQDCLALYLAVSGGICLMSNATQDSRGHYQAHSAQMELTNGSLGTALNPYNLFGTAVSSVMLITATYGPAGAEAAFLI